MIQWMRYSLLFTFSFPCSNHICCIVSFDLCTPIYAVEPICYVIAIIIVLVSIEFGTFLLSPIPCVHVATISGCVDSEVVAIVFHTVVVAPFVPSFVNLCGILSLVPLMPFQLIFFRMN